MVDQFVHLHCHSEFSMLDGASKVEDMVASVKADGQPGLGLTDHGNMYGAIPFYKACKAADITPILGTELYQTEGSRFDRPVARSKSGSEEEEISEGHKLHYHLTALATSTAGYHNLIQLSSRSFLESYYRKPRVDFQLLSEHAEGIVATSGCLVGLICQTLLRGDYKGALDHAATYQQIYGRENFYIEMQDHGIPEQRQVYPQLLRISNELNAPLLATADSHYTNAEDAKLHDVLLCVQTGSTLADPNRFKFSSDQHWLKSAQEMRHLFRELPQACDSSLAICDQTQIDIEFGNLHLPKFPVPEGFEDDNAYLGHLVLKGADSRYPNMTDAEMERIVLELRTVIDMGFSSYFLILWDLVEFAHRNNIVLGPGGRGSAAGSAAAYCLGITGLDPIKYDLYFERFLNPARVSMPDIDIDMATDGRDQMIRYVADKYGQDHVTQIITYTSIKSRTAIRDAARVLSKPYAVGDRISKALPPLAQGRVAPLAASFEMLTGWEEAYAKSEQLRSLATTDPDVAEVLEAARGLEGLRKSDGVHAASVVIADSKITDYVPVQRKGEDAPVVCQYEMHAVEDLGLLKMDFLGLKNLDVIRDCLSMIEEPVDFGDFTDAATYDLLRSGEAIGVFQLESSMMRALLRRLKPDSFGDIAAVLALCRPGPMAANMHNDYADRKNGLQTPAVFHPDAREILGATQGLMIFQEQVMAIARKFAGFSLAEADLLRRAIGKKIPEEMAALNEAFINGCISSGYGKDFGDKLFATIDKFSAYSFNAGHSYGYAVISFQTAFLKANYPAQYMAALCTHAKIEKRGVFLAEARRMGLEILGPDVNESLVQFSAQPGAVRVGLGSVRDIGKIAGEILSVRTNAEPYSSITDFATRCVPIGVGRKAIVALAHAGAFDSLGVTRMGVTEVVDELLKFTKAQIKQRAAGQVSLFGDDITPFGVPAIEFTDAHRLHTERLAVGLYVTGHPLEELASWASKNRDRQIIDLEDAPEGTYRLTGVVTNLVVSLTKLGKAMAKFDFEDLTGSIPMIAFPKTFQDIDIEFAEEAVAAIRMRIGYDNEGERNFILISANVHSLPQQDLLTEPLRVHLPAGFSKDPAKMALLKGTLLKHRGSRPVMIHVSKSAGTLLNAPYYVNDDERLIDDLRVVFGS